MSLLQWRRMCRRRCNCKVQSCRGETSSGLTAVSCWTSCSDCALQRQTHAAACGAGSSQMRQACCVYILLAWFAMQAGHRLDVWPSFTAALASACLQSTSTSLQACSRLSCCALAHGIAALHPRRSHWADSMVTDSETGCRADSKGCRCHADNKHQAAGNAAAVRSAKCTAGHGPHMQPPCAALEEA